MRQFSILGAILFGLFGASGALAQHDDHMVLGLCQRLCYTSLGICPPGVAPDDPACLTRRVVCERTCQPCLDGRAACAKGGDFDLCLREHASCVRARTEEGAKNHSPVAFKGGDGSSKEQAVVISGATDEIEGVSAEGVWTALKHPDWRKQKQNLIHEGRRAYDLIEYDTPTGKGQAWFDITEFFGKLEPLPEKK